MTDVASRLPDHLHPLVAKLRANPSSEATFWAQIAEVRTPLIEPDPTSADHSIVTYIFALPEGAHRVVVLPGFSDHEPAGNVMARIDGTHVCHASYRYRNDVRTSYSFVPDLPLTSWETADEAEM